MVFSSRRKYSQIMSKRIKTEDCVQDLPEELIYDILSRLSTKDAARTRVLSKEWERKWVSFTRDIDIDDKDSFKRHDVLFMGNEGTNKLFIKFVTHIIAVSCDIRSFALRLTCGKYDYWRIHGWISHMLKRNIESLVLVYKFGSNQYLLPSALNDNTSLRNLELRLRCTFKVDARFSFPYLKSLILSEVEILNEVPNSYTMTLMFPLLETLVLDNSPFLKAKMVEVHAPLLTTFHRTLDVNPKDDYSIEIVSKRLVEFKFAGSVLEKIILTGHQISCATLRYNSTYTYTTKMRIHFEALLNAFSSLKELEISGHFTWVVSNPAVEFSLPVLHHLDRLVVRSYMTHGRGLLEFLYKAPLLKYLKIDTSSVSLYNYTSVEQVPICVKDCLAEIEWDVDNDIMDQLDLLKFLLENGKVLKKVRVTCYNAWTRATQNKILEKLSELSSSIDVTFVVSHKPLFKHGYYLL